MKPHLRLSVYFKNSFSGFRSCVSHPLISASGTEDLLSQLLKDFIFVKRIGGNKILEHKNVAMFSRITNSESHMKANKC